MSQGWLTLHPGEAQGHLEAALEGGLPERESLFARATMAYLDGSLEPLPELRAYVRSHPDDADAWFILGDALLHAGTGEEIDDWLEQGKRALDRAVELDPGFAPYLIHALQLALRSGDSAHVAGITENFGAVRPGTPNDRVNRIILREEFGRSDSVSIAAAADTLGDLGLYPDMLLHSARSVELAEAHYLRQAEASGEIDLRLCLNIPLRDGSLRKLIEYAADPRMDRDVAFLCPYMARILGLPISDQLLDQTAERLPPDERERPGLFRAARAVERGEWDEYESVLTGLRERLAAAEAAGDSTADPDWEIELRTAEAFGLMARGRAADAAAAFESLKGGWWPNRWWLGQLYLELDQPHDAIRWFSTFVGVSNAYWPIAYLYLGQAYEALGEVDKARTAYASFVEMWGNADPELQPMVEEARTALLRLGPMDQ
jgi:tetratricopeptide (TPR) repeat protein